MWLHRRLLLYAGAAVMMWARTLAETLLPAVYLIYDMNSFPGKVELQCKATTSDTDPDYTFVPDYADNPKASCGGSWCNFTWGDGTILARGVECSAGHMKVFVPLVGSAAELLPDSLTLVLSKDQDLVLKLKNKNGNDRIKWQKEPVYEESWRTTTLDGGRVVIPASEVNGSGYYSLLPSTGTGADKTKMGTFHLIKRDCPRDKYGNPWSRNACQSWCPDCQNGGVCHAGDGRCLCPLGLTGDYCQHRCSETGDQCLGKLLPDLRGKQVCLPVPMGCSCAPGYTGDKCDQACGRGRWGPDCSLECDHCKEDCDHRTGTCDSKGPSELDECDSAKGGVGLPRLRQRPKVTDFGYDSARVVFQAWEATNDDGQMPDGFQLDGYIVKYGIVGGKTYPDLDVASARKMNSLVLRDLDPGVEHWVKVLVRLKNSQKSCTEEGSARFRVHKVTFTTTCPTTAADLPVPEGLNATVYARSISIQLPEVAYLHRCKLAYHLLVSSPTTTEVYSGIVESNSKVIRNLDPFTNYTILLRTYYNKTSEVYSQTKKLTSVVTLPLAPGKPNVRLVSDGNTPTFKWTKQPDDRGNFFYRHQERIAFKATCSDQPSWSRWSEWSQDTSVTLARRRPYTATRFRMQARNEGGTGEQLSDAYSNAPAAVPDNKVLRLQCEHKEPMFRDNHTYECTATLEQNCTLENGGSFSVMFFIESSAGSDNIYQDGSKIYVTNSKATKEYDEGKLLPYVMHTVKAAPSNEAGTNRTNEKSTTFRTRPKAPGKLMDVQVSEASTSLRVMWGEPEDDPPKGVVEKIKIKWDSSGSVDDGEHILSFTAREYTITGLEPNKEYTVTVSAKNEDVDDYGTPVSVKRTTQEGKPTQPRALKDINTTTNSLTLIWQPPEHPEGNIVNYNATLHLNDTNATEKVTEKKIEGSAVTTAKFGKLLAGRKYLATVTACNSRKCSDEASWEVWTLPEKPKVTGQLQQVGGSTSSVTLNLPKPDIFPSEVYVLVRNEDDSEQQEDPKTFMDNLLNDENQSKNDHSPNMWVAGLLHQGEDNVMEQFVIGDKKTYGGYYNKPLQHNRQYAVNVAVVTRAGQKYQVFVTPSVTVVAKELIFPWGTIAGVILVIILVMYYRIIHV